MEIPPDAVGFAIAVTTTVGAVVGVTLLVRGKEASRRLRRGGGDPELHERLADLEERVRRLSEVLVDQSGRLDDYDERLDFTERVLTREDARRALRAPHDGP